MNVLLEKMFIKRFCLPGNIDVENYTTNEKERRHSISHMSNSKSNKDVNINKIQGNCTCGNYHHVACTFYKVGSDFKKISVVTYGMNKYVDTEGLSPSIHAEYDAVVKLPCLNNKNKKKLSVIHLIVVRMSKTKKIQTSKPCVNCIRSMRQMSTKRGYKIKHVYYSENDGIIKTNLANLEKEEEKHISKFYRRRNEKQLQEFGIIVSNSNNNDTINEEKEKKIQGGLKKIIKNKDYKQMKTKQE
jgi:hypothetical protein